MNTSVKLHINGSSDILVAPERGELRISVSKKGPEPRALPDEVNKVARSILSTIETLAGRDFHPESQGAGVTPLKTVTNHTVSIIASKSYNVYNDRRRGSGESLEEPRTEHEATMTLTAEFADFVAFGHFANEVAMMPLASVTHISWSLTPATRAATEAKAITKAYEIARAKAEVYAAAVGKRHVVPIDIQDHDRHSGVGRDLYFACEAPRGAQLDEGIDPKPKDVPCFVSCSVMFECS